MNLNDIKISLKSGESMATNEERHAATRERILTAATDLFLNNGYKKTSIAMIAGQAGVSPVTLYKYFDSKIVLGHQVVLKMVVDGYAQYQKLVDDPSIDFRKLIRQMIVMSTDTAKRMSTDFYTFIVKDMQGKLGTDETMKAYQNGKAKFWGTVIGRGRKAGLIRPEISDQALMMYLDMFIQYVQNPQNDSLYQHPIAMKMMTDEIIHLFFYGFIGHAPVKQQEQ
jgi:AcrR family transcriptional regulator